ncbi:MAG: carbohydrate ABC transporter permease [Candidatus Wallbacteria bacterium]|nr:carbohydrate ABC transporter permease [Candidatus Wallbacteria bacterium]
MSRIKLSPSKFLIHLILLLGAIAMVMPFYWMVSTSLKTSQEVLQFPPKLWPDTMQWGNYAEAFTKQPFGRYFLNTFFIALATTGGQLLLGSLAAFAFTFMEFPLKNTIFMLLLSTMMIPQQALLIPDYIVLSKLGWIDTFNALIVPWMGSVFTIFLLRQFFMQLPKDLYDAAKIDGCTKLRFFFQIILPLSVPPMITAGIFNFLGSWNSFLWPLMVTNSQEMRTIQVGLAYFSQDSGTAWELLSAAATFCTLPLVIGYFMAQKQFIEGVARSGMKE